MNLDTYRRRIGDSVFFGTERRRVERPPTLRPVNGNADYHEMLTRERLRALTAREERERLQATLDSIGRFEQDVAECQAADDKQRIRTIESERGR